MTTAVESVYQPSAWQQNFHNRTEHEVFGAGSAGPGKSLCLLMDPIQLQVQVEQARVLRDPTQVPGLTPEHKLFQLIEENPLDPGGSDGWAIHLRREARTLNTTLSRAHKYIPVIDPGARWDGKNDWYVFSSGYKYQFGHCHDKDGWLAFNSNDFTHIGYDELIEFEEEQYSQINTRLRTTDPVLKYLMRIRAASNPDQRRRVSGNVMVSNPKWVKERFVDPHPGGNVVIREWVKTSYGKQAYDRIFLPATLYDNPDKEFVRIYEFKLASAKPHIRAAQLYGSWEVTIGSYHAEEWNKNLHVCPPFRVPRHWPAFRSMDWGFKKPGCVHWWVVDEDDNLFCIHELTFKGKHDHQVAETIRAIEMKLGYWDKKRNRSRIMGPADDQLWEERGNSGVSKAAVMAQKGVNWYKANKKSRVANAIKLSGRLTDHGEGTMTPGIVFFDTCERIIHTLPGIQTDADDSECPQDGGDDHWYDSTLYAVAHASRGRSVMHTGEDDDDDFTSELPLGREPVSNWGAGMGY